MAEYRQILIIKPSSLGDIVHALPTLSALRTRFPRATISWLVKREWADLLKRVEGLDRVWPVRGGLPGWLAQVRGLRAARFDLVVDLQGLLRSGMMARLAGAPVRIGLANAREGSPWLYTHRVGVPEADMHAIDRYLLVARALGATVPPRPVYALRPSIADHDRVARLRQAKGLSGDRPYIAMVVSARWPTKRWPAAFFADTADRIQQEGLGRVALIGGLEDRGVAQQVTRAMKTDAVDLVDACGVGLLPALLQTASLLVSNDSGPMHVAAAMGTPVVALFGPTSPSRTGPYGPRHLVLQNPVPCSPCFSTRCRNATFLECLTGISPSEVVTAVRQRARRA